MKHSAGTEFRDLAVHGKKMFTSIFMQHLGMVTKKSCKLLE